MWSTRRDAGLKTAGFVVLIVVGLSAPARSDDPVTSAVRFNREIIRIFQRKCLACHSPGGIAMSLATHREARPWARAIREEIIEQRMPPWSAARGYARFENDIGLTPRELTTILTWLDGGVPKGDDIDLPPSSFAGMADLHASADYTLALAPQPVPGDGEDVVRRITIDSGLTTDRWVQQLRFRPGDRRLLRAAFVSVVPSNALATRDITWAAAWTPWQPFIVSPPGAAFLIRAGSRLSLELHYRGRETAAVDRSSVDVVLAAGQAWRELTSIAVPATRALGTPTRLTGELVLARGATVWALRPESLAEGQSLEVTARKPDGSVHVLLWIPRYHTDWPAPFVLTQPVQLQPGTLIRVTAAGTPKPTGARAILAVHH